MRDLLRYRVNLLEQRNHIHNKIRDVFETANPSGVTGQKIIEALIAGETWPDKLSWKVNLLELPVPGINETVAWTVIAEMGTKMGVFPASGHVASWECVQGPTRAPASR